MVPVCPSGCYFMKNSVSVDRSDAMSPLSFGTAEFGSRLYESQEPTSKTEVVTLSILLSSGGESQSVLP